jgi:hypothetical protein
MSSIKTFKPINPADAIPADKLIAMCDAARTKYAAEIAADDHFKWYKDFIRFDFKLNDHSTGCKFENVEVFYNGKWRWLQVLIKKERLNGSIQPIDASEAARLSAELSSSKFQREIKPREVTAKPYTCINMTRQRCPSVLHHHIVPGAKPRALTGVVRPPAADGPHVADVIAHPHDGECSVAPLEFAEAREPA